MTAEQEALLRELREQIGELRAEVSDLEATVADLVQRVEQLAGPSLWWLLSLPVAVIGEVLRRVGAVVPGLPRCEGAGPDGAVGVDRG
ncbi:TMF family protein [Nocardia cyriacigeorgica]|uniref:TMF family protein n=1 Tax=Nocardia cyriacigeorgica TaxID=135487 RepID=UPI00189573D2|nr:TMF family protein [Nocardia cyriacigeorgica]MBF6512919.1 TMF family protein [Nocardia cyriacigeorgica]